MDAKDQKDKLTILYIGNPGSGKSYLLNTQINEEIFESKMSFNPVTVKEESFYDQKTNSVYWNLQGVLERLGRNLQRNLISHDKAFSSASKHIVYFVVRHQNTRLSLEDVLLFKEFQRVYSFDRDSIILVINGKPKDAHEDWLYEFVALFQEASNYIFKHWCVMDEIEDRSISLKNKIILDDIMKKAKPCKFQRKEGQEMKFDVVERERLKVVIQQLINQMKVERKQHESIIQRIQQQIQQINQQSEELKEKTKENDKELEKVINYWNEKKRLVESDHQKQMKAIQDYVTECIRQSQQALKEAEEYQNQVRATIRKNKRVHKQLERVGRSMLKKPLQTGLMIGSMVLAPYATPFIASTLGVGAVAAGATYGAAAGVVNSVANKQNVLKGGATGLIAGGAASFVQPLSSLSATSLSVQAASSAASSLINRQPVLLNMVGSVAGSVVSSRVNIGDDLTRNVTKTAVSETTRSLIVDPKNMVESVARSVVVGSIVGAAHHTIKENSEIKQREREVKETKEKEVKVKDVKEPQYEKPNQEPQYEKPKPKPQYEKPNQENNEPQPQASSSSSFNHNQQTITIDPHGATLESNGFLVTSNGGIGYKTTSPDGQTETVKEVLPSSIYLGPGGTQFNVTVTKSLPPSSSSSSSSSSSTASHPVTLAIDTPKTILHEDIGYCVSTRTTQHQTYENGNWNQPKQVTIHERHFNADGCIRDPGLILVGAGAGLGLGLGSVLSTTPVLVPAFSN